MMKRRKFIVSAAAAVPTITLFPSDLSGMARTLVPGQLEKRSLGRTGEMLSVVGFGGIVVMNATPGEASDAVTTLEDVDTILGPGGCDGDIP
jgi:hypothetical protein